eukprot:maker-scaffold103_size370364-snap-gene-0.16 protein:Tk07509 transcript:maker-scaffold103_size370364-snap-gene-0.16-mRNA-1 annotation:"hypothetical protein Y032_0044g935"
MSSSRLLRAMKWASAAASTSLVARPVHVLIDMVRGIRPIAILPALSKVLETIVYQDLNNHLEEQPPIWVQAKSLCNNAPGCCPRPVDGGPESGLVVGVAAFDMSAAFDTVEHLLPNMEALGTSASSEDIRSWWKSINYQFEDVFISAKLAYSDKSKHMPSSTLAEVNAEGSGLKVEQMDAGFGTCFTFQAVEKTKNSVPLTIKLNMTHFQTMGAFIHESYEQTGLYLNYWSRSVHNIEIPRQRSVDYPLEMKFSDWTLERTHGQYKLEFSVGQKAKSGPSFRRGQYRRGKRSRIRIKASDLQAMVQQIQVKVEPPPTSVPPSLSVPPLTRKRLSSFGTTDSCETDSLFWDDYDVEKPKTPVLNFSDTSALLKRSPSTISLAESDISDMSSEGSMIGVKEGSPDNLREGRLLLREMKELRREIKKMGDASTIAVPFRKQLSMTGAINQEIQEMLSSLDKDDSKMWDSGYLEGPVRSPTLSIPSLTTHEGSPELEDFEDDDMTQCEEEFEVELDENESSRRVDDHQIAPLDPILAQVTNDRDTLKDRDEQVPEKVEIGAEFLKSDPDDVEHNGGKAASTHLDECGEGSKVIPAEDQGPFLIGQLNLLSVERGNPVTQECEKRELEATISENAGYNQSKVVQDIVNEKYADIRQALLDFAQPRSVIHRRDLSLLPPKPIEDDFDQRSKALAIVPPANKGVLEDKKRDDDEVASPIREMNKKLSKNQKKKLKKKHKQTAPSSIPEENSPSRRIAEPNTSFQPDLSSWLPSAYLGSSLTGKANAVEKIISDALASIDEGNLSESDFEAQLLREIILNTSPRTSYYKLRHLIYRDLFEWETGFCENEQRFVEIMGKKLEANKRYLKKCLPAIPEMAAKSQPSKMVSGAQALAIFPTLAFHDFATKALGMALKGANGAAHVVVAHFISLSRSFGITEDALEILALPPKDALPHGQRVFGVFVAPIAGAVVDLHVHVPVVGGLLVKVALLCLPILGIRVEHQARAALVPGHLHLLLEEPLLSPRLLTDIRGVRTSGSHIIVEGLVTFPLLAGVVVVLRVFSGRLNPGLRLTGPRTGCKMAAHGRVPVIHGHRAVLSPASRLGKLQLELANERSGQPTGPNGVLEEAGGRAHVALRHEMRRFELEHAVQVGPGQLGGFLRATRC